MTNGRNDEPKPVRLVFELARADNPRLYDELVLFGKGAKRVNRLRVLAYDGLLAQQGVLGWAPDRSPAPTMERTAFAGAAELTNAVFAPGLAE
ncbi:MAG: hypothetical protein DI587_03700 [Variovorax paradoxus]|nr:MAG: hypothetical protein DI583_03700 [Variovorax paradoxus]PZQ15179.1 MAG: hypothetical protein DI587_03700 [Variovorax paradoxus]